MSSADHELENDAPPPQRGSFLSLPVILVIGLVIYEVTQQPAIAAMAMCLKFGSEDFRTAWWLLHTDPQHGRGRACCWLYVASGLWQIAVIGVAMVILAVCLDAVIEQARQGPGAGHNLDKLLFGAGFTILFGFVFSTAATYIALLYSWRCGVRPLVERSGQHCSAQARMAAAVWPSESVARTSYFNRADDLLHHVAGRSRDRSPDFPADASQSTRG